MICIKMGNDESQCSVSLIVRDKVTRPCAQTTTFFFDWLMIAYIALFSALLSRLTALACGSTSFM